MNETITALVTGAAGFLGKRLVRELCLSGVRVIAVVKDTASAAELNGVEVVVCPMEHISDLPKLLPCSKIDWFYHLAWSGVAGPAREAVSLQIGNITTTIDTVQMCHVLGCKRFIFAASIMEYECFELMQTEKKPSGANAYSTAKLTADFMAKILCAKLEIEYISAVISNIFGAGESARRFITSTLQRIRDKKPLSFTAGEQMYDFIYVDDAAKAFVSVGFYGKPFKQYYIGTQNPRPLKEFLFELRDCIDPQLELGLGEITFEGASLDYYKQFDLKALEEDTGYTPQISFKDGIKRIWDYMAGGGGFGNFQFNSLCLDGLMLVTPVLFCDNRGYFLKNYEKNIFCRNGLDINFYETFETRSHKGVVRGLHFQRRFPQTKLVRAIQGCIYDVVVDLRPDSDTFGKWQGVYLDDHAHHSLLIPKGFAHGFLVLSETATVSYQCVGPYVPEFDDGLFWKDQDIGINWPVHLVENITLSEKDQAWGTLSQVNKKYFANL